MKRNTMERAEELTDAAKLAKTIQACGEGAWKHLMGAALQTDSRVKRAGEERAALRCVHKARKNLDKLEAFLAPKNPARRGRKPKPEPKPSKKSSSKPKRRQARKTASPAAPSTESAPAS